MPGRDGGAVEINGRGKFLPFFGNAAPVGAGRALGALPIIANGWDALGIALFHDALDNAGNGFLAFAETNEIGAAGF
ncbi:MAG: hypothetical protein QGF09_01985 [Rhodospirillales bacterium]|jgi:hypothetical protein|nr:hypothetical protein [Rhodospirillales bacterium]